jgi:hypothetical protein
MGYEEDEDEEVTDAIFALEETLIQLSMAVANYLATWIAINIARPLVVQTRMRGLRIEHIGDAVVEISGEEWLDLPFNAVLRT